MLPKKGFTLIELLVVLVIIGILVALILPNALRAIRQANTKECASNIRSLDAATQMFYTENRTWPTTLDVVAPYLEEGVLPTCPFSVTYTILSNTSGTRINKGTHFGTNWPNQHQ